MVLGIVHFVAISFVYEPSDHRHPKTSQSSMLGIGGRFRYPSCPNGVPPFAGCIIVQPGLLSFLTAIELPCQMQAFCLLQA